MVTFNLTLILIGAAIISFGVISFFASRRLDRGQDE